MFTITRTGILLALSTVLVATAMVTTSRATDAESLPPGNAEEGAKTYKLVCATCHGDRAQGNLEFNAPRLVGQEPWYMARQLKNFASGIRGADPRDVYGAQMRPMAMTLQGDQAIADVIAFIGTLSNDAP